MIPILFLFLPFVHPFLISSCARWPAALFRTFSKTESIQGDDTCCPPTGFYIHIPYCRKRCRYCNFSIVPIGTHDGQNSGFDRMNEQYTAALLEEIQMIKRRARSQGPIRLQSIYFGGGTPSLAPISTIKAVLESILYTPESPFELDPEAEISIEIDPGTFDLAKLEQYKALGLNRFSLGAQAFQDSILEGIGRVHRVSDIDTSVTMLRSVFGESVNFSMDLISGLPGQSLEDWSYSIQRAMQLSVPHLSLYDLQVEEGTVFGTWYNAEAESHRKLSYRATKGSPPAERVALPSDEEAANMYRYASTFLRSQGYEHYEISSYAKLGIKARSRHNQVYWNPDGQWFAIGMGATSFVDRTMTARPRTLADYHEWVNSHRETNFDALDKQDNFDRLMDVVLKRLRTSDGLSLTWIKETFPLGELYVAAISQGVQLALELKLAFLEHNNSTLRLADPDGFLFSNTIISSIFVELEKIEEAVPPSTQESRNE